MDVGMNTLAFDETLVTDANIAVPDGTGDGIFS